MDHVHKQTDAACAGVQNARTAVQPMLVVQAPVGHDRISEHDLNDVGAGAVATAVDRRYGRGGVLRHVGRALRRCAGLSGSAGLYRWRHRAAAPGATWDTVVGLDVTTVFGQFRIDPTTGEPVGHAPGADARCQGVARIGTNIRGAHNRADRVNSLDRGSDGSA